MDVGRGCVPGRMGAASQQSGTIAAPRRPLIELHRMPAPTESEPPEQLPARSVRSYVVRAGRMGTGQVRALAELAPRYVLPFAAPGLDVQAAFGRAAPLVLEIGFGMGAATADIAAAKPQVNYLGVEVHPPGVGALLQRLHHQQLNNVRIIQHDAVEVLQHMLPVGSLAGVHVFFPDP